MLQSSIVRDDHRTTENLSQIRVKICSVRLPSSIKLVDICISMEVDNKYTYRTDVIRKKNKSQTNSSTIIVNESLDIIATLNSKILMKIFSPTRLFGNHDIGQLQFNIKSIVNSYNLSEQNNNNDPIPSYVAKLPYENLTRSSSIFRSHDSNNTSSGIIEIIFYGSLFRQQDDHRNPQNSEQQTRQLSSELVKDNDSEKQDELLINERTSETNSTSINNGIHSTQCQSDSQTNGTEPVAAAAAAVIINIPETKQTRTAINGASVTDHNEEVCIEIKHLIK